MAINPLQAPINYAGMVPQINIGQQFAEFGQALAERQKNIQAQDLKAAYSLDLSNAIKNPTQETWSGMIAKYPQAREAFTEARKGFGEVAATNEFNQGFEVSMALENGRPDIAQERLLKIITARKSANLPTGIYQQTLDELDLGNTTGAQAGVNYALSMADPDRFKKQVDARTTAAKAPSEVTKSAAEANKAVTEAQQKVADLRIKLQDEPIEAERLVIKRDLERAQAEKAQVDSKYANQIALADLKKKAADLRKTDADILINKENARIAALNAAQGRETNVIRRQELRQKIAEATEKRDQTDREQQATFANQLADIDNFINTATLVKQTPRDIINSATGPIASKILTTNQDVSDFEALVETLGSQIFVAQIPKIKGTGALSEKEGDKLQASVQNLSLKQSPDRLLSNVNEAVRLLTKARVNISVRSGLPATPIDAPAGFLNVTVGGKTYEFTTKEAADTFRGSDAYKKAAGTK